MKKTRFLLIFGLALFLLLPLGALAYEAKAGSAVYVGKDETVAGNLYAAGNTVTVDGTVEGDVICAAQAVNINGTVGGNARLAGNSVTINGTVAKNAMVFAASLALGAEAEVDGDLLLAAASAESRGKIGGTLHGAGSSVVIDGQVGGDVRLRLDERSARPASAHSLELRDNAEIGGNVVYTAGRQALIADNAVVSGQVTFSEAKQRPAYKTSVFAAWGKLISFFAALVIGLVLVSLWRSPINELARTMLRKRAAALGWGLVIMFLTPILAFLLMITLIGIPLSLITLALWLIALYVAKILAGIALGVALMEKWWPKHKDSLTRGMIFGIALLWLIGWLPVLGWAVTLAATWWGLGGIWLALKRA